MMEVFVNYHNTRILSFDGYPSNLAHIVKKHLSETEKISPDNFELYCDGALFHDDIKYFNERYLFLTAELADGLLGGKGGFGAALRRMAKQSGPRKTTDFGACRDLSGRRIRHVNDEILLQKWQEAKERGEELNVDEETPSGIKLWFLPTPSWSEGFGKKRKNQKRKFKRKSELCSDWMTAHESDKKIPINRPSWWGCPRGERCDYAHGIDDLNPEAYQAYIKQQQIEYHEKEKQKLLQYMNPVSKNNSSDRYNEDEEVEDLVMKGLQHVHKKQKIIHSNETTNDNEVQVDNKTSIKYMNNNINTTVDEDENSSDEDSEVKENTNDDDLDPIIQMNESKCPYIHILTGDVLVFADGSIHGQNEFSTVIVKDCHIQEEEGSYYYEVKLASDGLMQIGWACSGFQCDAYTGDGVGDDHYSWGYDGYRHHIFHGETHQSYPIVTHDSTSSSNNTSTDIFLSTINSVGNKDIIKDSNNQNTTTLKDVLSSGWKSGDIIGCMLTITTVSDTTTKSHTNATNTSVNEKKVTEGKKTRGRKSTTKKDDITSSTDADIKSHKICHISYYHNGVNLGLAYEFPYPKSSSTATATTTTTGDGNNNTTTTNITKGIDNDVYFYPALSIDSEQQVQLSIHSSQFLYPPPSNNTTTTTTTSNSLLSQSSSTQNSSLSNRSKVKAIGDIIHVHVPSSLQTDQSTTTSNTISLPHSSQQVISSSLSHIKETTKIQLQSEAIKSHSSTTTNTSNILSTTNDTISSTTTTISPASTITIYQPIDINSSQYDTIDSLLALSPEYLKHELSRRGLKCGGTIQERATRLFSIRGLSDDKIPSKLKIKK